MGKSANLPAREAIWEYTITSVTYARYAHAYAYWRIRLAAYVARLERVLGAIPQGFKSPILRH